MERPLNYAVGNELINYQIGLSEVGSTDNYIRTPTARNHPHKGEGLSHSPAAGCQLPSGK